MFNLLKSFGTLLLLSLSLTMSAQEICDNGIDDDGDSLVDLNDPDCDCPTEVPLLNIQGHVCETLRLDSDDTDVVAYQWYRDGVAISGRNSQFLFLREGPPMVEGDYQCLATTTSGCFISEPHNVVIDSVSTYLGVRQICQGDTIMFGDFSITTQGSFKDILRTTEGCDSTVVLDVIVVQDEAYFENLFPCTGTSIDFGPNTITEDGVYMHTFQSVGGCDSLVQLTVDFEPLPPFEETATICQGEEYVFRGQILTETGIYTDTAIAADGCDSTFVVNLTATPPLVTDRPESICAGGEIEIDGTIYDAEGDYQINLVAADGCDSIVNLILEVLEPEMFTRDEVICLGLVFEYGDIAATETGQYVTTISTPGVCDSLVTINLTVEDPTPVVEQVTLCPGGTIEWRGDTYDSAGDHTVTEELAGECDKMYTLQLDFHEPVVEAVTESICAGGMIEIAGEIFTEEDYREVTLVAANGCDSLVQITVTEDNAQEYSRNVEICRGEVFVYNNGDIEEMTPGSYSTLVATPGECDSLITFELAVNDPEPQIEEMTICQGLSVEWNGQTLDTEGTYDFLEETPGECDELYQLVLGVTAPTPITSFEELCDGDVFEFGDLKATESGIYETTISTPGECDELYVFDLDFMAQTESVEDFEICDGDVFILHDIETMTPGTYMTVIPNAQGCDSTITVNLMANFIATTEEPLQICEGDVLSWNGEEYTEEGSYPVTLTDGKGCDSIATLLLSFSDLIEVPLMSVDICEGEVYDEFGITATETGMYQNTLSSGGCDSLIQIDLTVNPNTTEQLSAQICEGETYVLANGDEVSEEDFYVTVIRTLAGCDSTIMVDLTVISHEPSEETVEICEGDSYEFHGETYDVAGTYPAALISSQNCDSLASLNLVVLALGERTEEVLICPGDEYVFNDIVTTEAGVFTTQIQNSAGCDSIITVMVDILDPSEQLDLGEDKLINIGATVDIIPEFISPSLTDFEWLDENGDVLGMDEELLGFAPLEDTYVEFLAQNEFGCLIRERLNIDVELIIDIFIPNVITPNSETSDAYFTMGANESVLGIRELHIFDRWGELLFTDDHNGNLDPYIGWDGTFKGEVVMGGVYTYLVVFDIIDGTTVQRGGSVTVIK